MLKKSILLLALFSLFHTLTFAEVSEEKLVVEYSRGLLPAQQALIQEMIKQGSAQPIEKNSSIKGFNFLLKDPIHHILRQGRIYKREYPLNIQGSKQFEVLSFNDIGGGIGTIAIGFQMGIDYSPTSNGDYQIFFHSENHTLEGLLGKNTAKVRTYHSAGSTIIYPNSGKVVLNIDGEGGFVLFTYIKSEKF